MYESLEAQVQGVQLEAAVHLEMVRSLYSREGLGLSVVGREKCILVCKMVRLAVVVSARTLFLNRQGYSEPYSARLP